MRFYAFLCLFSALVILQPPGATAQTPPGSSELAANAAVQYWQAFAQMPTLDKDQEKILAEWNTVSLDDPAVQKLLAASHSSVMYLQRGAKLPRCDWGLDYNDGVSLLLPHLNKARDLARLAMLHGRNNFEHGNMKGARVIATSIMTLGRHVRRDPIMISVLVGYVIEGMAIDLSAPYIPELKANYAQARTMLETLPSATRVQDTIGIEKKFFVEWMIGKLKEEEQRKKGAGLELWKNFLTGSPLPDSLKNVVSVDEAAKMIQELLPIYDEIAKLVALPKEQFDQQYPAFKQKTKAAHPLAGVIVPAVDDLLAKEHKHQARMAMLMAAIAVAESGPDALKDIKDPFGPGPFEYRTLDKGFELKSKLLYEGQPVTMTFGQRK
jgi:hypothetical protein